MVVYPYMAFILTLKVPIRMGQRANRSEIFEEVNGKPLIWLGKFMFSLDQNLP